VFSDDGTRLITVNRGLESVVRIWDLPSGQLRRTIGPFEHPVEGVDINPDGSLVLVASGVDPSLWDVDSGDVVAELHGHSEFVYGASFSADGRFVATAGGDGSARVWDTLTGVEIGAQSADGDAVLDVALGSGGELLTLGVDGTARVFVCDACRISNELSDLAAELLSARPR
jgi:WD40 repeat protein